MGLEGPTQGQGTTYDNSNNKMGRSDEEQRALRASEGFTSQDDADYANYYQDWHYKNKSFFQQLFAGKPLTYAEFMRKNRRGAFADPNVEKKDLGSVQGTGPAITAETKGADAKAASDAAASDDADVQAKIKAFYDEMNQPLNLNDPKVKVILNGARNGAQQDASNRGVSGGLSDAGINQAYTNAAAGLQQQRSQLGLQALSLAGSHGLGIDQLRNNQYQYANNIDVGQQAAAYNQAKAANASGWGLVGGLAGGIIGGVATQSPQGAIAGYQVGSGLGAGVAGSNYGPMSTTYGFSGANKNSTRNNNSGGLSGGV